MARRPRAAKGGADEEGGLEAFGEDDGVAGVADGGVGDRGEDGEAEGAADLLGGVDQAAGEALLAVLDAGDPETAAIVTGTKAKPRPTAASREGPGMSARKLSWAKIRENQISPTAISTMPAARIGLKPTRVSRFEAIPAERMIETASGR